MPFLKNLKSLKIESIKNDEVLSPILSLLQNLEKFQCKYPLSDNDVIQVAQTANSNLQELECNSDYLSMQTFVDYDCNILINL